MGDEAVKFQIRIAVLETELKYIREAREATERSSLQTISNLTATILSLTQSHNHSQNQSQVQGSAHTQHTLPNQSVTGHLAQKDNQSRKSDEKEDDSEAEAQKVHGEHLADLKNQKLKAPTFVLNSNKRASVVEVEILHQQVQRLQQQLQTCKLEIRSIKASYHQATHEKTAKLAQQGAGGGKRQEESFELDDNCEGHRDSEDDETEILQSSHDRRGKAKGKAIPSQNKNACDEFNVTIDTSCNSDDTGIEPAVLERDYDQLEEETDLELLDDVIGPDPYAIRKIGKERQAGAHVALPPRSHGLRREGSGSSGQWKRSCSLKGGFSRDESLTSEGFKGEGFRGRFRGYEDRDLVQAAPVELSYDDMPVITSSEVEKAENAEEIKTVVQTLNGNETIAKSDTAKDAVSFLQIQNQTETLLKSVNEDLATNDQTKPATNPHKQDRVAQKSEPEELSGPALQSEMQDEAEPLVSADKKDEAASNSRDETTESAEIPATLPKPTILKSEKSVERLIAGKSYDLNTHKALVREPSAEPRSHRRITTYADIECGSPPIRTNRRVTSYSDVNYAPAPPRKEGSDMSRRRLEQYDFTPSGVPAFGSPVSGISTPIFVAPSQTTSSVAPLTTIPLCKNSNSPSKGVGTTELDKSNQSGSEHLRTVHIADLPASIDIHTLLSRVRGGAVLSAELFDTDAAKSPRGKFAHVEFLSDGAAAKYVEFANQHEISFSNTATAESADGKEVSGGDQAKEQKAVFKILSIPNRLLQSDGVSASNSRVLRIIDNPEGLSRMDIRNKIGPVSDLVDITMDAGRKMVISFSSAKAAACAKVKLIETKTSSSRRTEVEFTDDPCAGPFSEILEERVKVNQEGKSASATKDKIDIDGGRVDKIGAEGVDQARGKARIDWAEEMNELASLDNSADYTDSTREPEPTQSAMPFNRKLGIRGHRGLNSSRYATLLPGY